MRYVLVACIVLLMIPVYVAGIPALPDTVKSTCEPVNGLAAGGIEKVGFCEEIGFAVQRSYYFGLLRLPVYKAGVSLDLLNRTFLPALLIIAAAVLWRGRNTPETSERPEHWNDRDTVTPE